MRRLAIALLGGRGRASAVAAPDRGAADAACAGAGAADEPRPAPVDVLQVSGLFDPIVVDAIDEAIERSADRRRPGPHPAGQHARAGRQPGRRSSS